MTPSRPIIIPPPRFGKLHAARFRERPNRFLVRCHLPQLGLVDAFMPNPGRLRELLLPGVRLTLAENTGDHRKTRFTVIAVERNGAPVFLHTHVNNQVAGHLVSTGKIPTLEDAEIIASEVTVGRSRFDFRIRQGRRERLLEVKSVTLFGNGIAMFPDAVTERGRRHIIELAESGSPRNPHAVLFLVHTPEVRHFLPDYHTDPAFSQTLHGLRRKIDILPVSIGWTPRLRLRKKVRRLPIPWDYLAAELPDRGAYLVIARAAGNNRHTWYIFSGQAPENLTAAMNSHRRASKNAQDPFHSVRANVVEWHTLPIRGSNVNACAIAQDLAQHFQPVPAAHTASCPCPAHLFRHHGDPQSTPAFQRLLERHRMTYSG